MNFDASQLVSFESRSCWIFLGVLFLIGLISGWIFYPFTIGAFTRAIRSPWKHFTERCSTAFVTAIAVAFVGFKVAQNFTAPAQVPASHSPREQEEEKAQDPFDKATATAASNVATEVLEPEPANAADLSTPPSSPSLSMETDQPKPVETPPSPASDSSAKPKLKASAKQAVDPTPIKLAELKGELAKVNTQIESERARWTEALNTINQLTNFKKTPVKEGSPAYHRCMAASKVIHEVETGATTLKAEKARLEASIKELEK